MRIEVRRPRWRWSGDATASLRTSGSLASTKCVRGRKRLGLSLVTIIERLVRQTVTPLGRNRSRLNSDPVPNPVQVGCM